MCLINEHSNAIRLVLWMELRANEQAAKGIKALFLCQHGD